MSIKDYFTRKRTSSSTTSVLSSESDSYTDSEVSESDESDPQATADTTSIGYFITSQTKRSVTVQVERQRFIEADSLTRRIGRHNIPGSYVVILMRECFV